MIGKNFRRFSNDWKKIRGSGLQIPLCEFTAVIPRPPDRFNRVATQGGNRPHRGGGWPEAATLFAVASRMLPPLHRRSRGSATLPPGTPRGGTRFRASAVANWRHNGAVRRRSRVPARAKGRAANPHAAHGESHGFRPTPMRVAPTQRRGAPALRFLRKKACARSASAYSPPPSSARAEPEAKFRQAVPPPAGKSGFPREQMKRGQPKKERKQPWSP